MRGHEAVSFGGSQSAEHGWDNEPRKAPELRWEHVAQDTAVGRRSEPVPASALEPTEERSVCPRKWEDRATGRPSSRRCSPGWQQSPHWFSPGYP